MFNFDATLPLMALQFILLAVVLNAIFYKPLNKVLDERAEYIRQNEAQAREQLTKAAQITQEYEQKLSESRKASQTIIAQAQADAQKISAAKIAEAQQEAQAKKEQAAQEIEQQKQQALQQLEQQVDALSRQILEKLLGAELIK